MQEDLRDNKHVLVRTPSRLGPPVETHIMGYQGNMVAESYTHYRFLIPDTGRCWVIESAFAWLYDCSGVFYSFVEFCPDMTLPVINQVWIDISECMDELAHHHVPTKLKAMSLIYPMGIGMCLWNPHYEDWPGIMGIVYYNYGVT